MLLPKLEFNPENALTADQMREVDRVAVEDFGLEILQMMEIAAFQMATLIRGTIGTLDGKQALIVAGKGNNGGDAIACARYLHNWGVQVAVVSPEEVNQNAQHHLELAEKIGIPINHTLQPIKEPDFVIDGILGYAISGTIRSPFSLQIEQINAYGVPVFSYDIPSGLDPDNGNVHRIAVRAKYTLTLAYPKKGLFKEEAKPYVGELYLADISIPEAVYERVSQKFPEVNYTNPFKQASLLKIKVS